MISLDTNVLVRFLVEDDLEQLERARDRASFYQQAADVLCHHWDIDPQEPIPVDRLSKAAKRLGVAEASLLEDLDQLREKLGADLYPGTPG